MTSKLASAINSSAGAIVHATPDTTNASYINVSSTHAGAQTNYPIEITVSDPMAAAYPYLAANPSFQVVSEDMFGGSNGQASQYGTIYSYEAGYAPNGNVVTYADSVMGTWNFSYDAADRLVASQNTAVGSSNQFSGYYGCWSYDAYGNRLAEAMSATPCGNNPALQSWANYNTANNRMTSTMNATGGVTYDASGNLLLDGVNEYWYDAEGRLCAVNSPSQGLIQYIYDAEGARIGKQTLSAAPGTYATCAAPTLGTRLLARYLLGQGNEQVTELSGSQSSPAWAHTNLWIASRLSATYATDGLHYELADPLGTRRILADANGTVQERCTSLPFGDGEDCPTTPTEHLFTQHERDSETNNDYFGARYYASSMGRFMSPDWSAKEDPVPYATMADPQSLNLYAYVGNNPLSHVDLDGHVYCVGFWCSPTAMGDPLATRFLLQSAQSAQLAAVFSQWKNNTGSFAKLWSMYPSHSLYDSDPSAANSIWNLVGGPLRAFGKQLQDEGQQVNTCALRMSYALNKSGLSIPQQKGTYTGDGGAQYFLSVTALQGFLTKVLGPPEVFKSEEFSGPRGSTGIISFNVSAWRPGATGHFSLWNGSNLIDRSEEGYDRWIRTGALPESSFFWSIK